MSRDRLRMDLATNLSLRTSRRYKLHRKSVRYHAVTFLSRRCMGRSGRPTPLSPRNNLWLKRSRSRIKAATSVQNVILETCKPFSLSVSQRRWIWVVFPAPSIPEKLTEMTRRFSCTVLAVLSAARRLAAGGARERVDRSHRGSRGHDSADFDEQRASTPLLGRSDRNARRFRGCGATRS